MHLKEFLLDTLFPPHCLICQARQGATIKSDSLCGPCGNRITVHDTLFCILCRARLAENKKICHESAPLRLAAVGRYEDPSLRSLIGQLKYKRHTLAVNALAVLMRRYLQNLQLDMSDYTIVPIPLHPKRERERGFNQSLLLAERLGLTLHISLLNQVLIKTKVTLAQAKTQSLQERKKNLSGCFSITQPEAVRGRKILLVDDVCTSGTTLIEAAQTLKAAGAKQIIGFVMART